VEVSGDGCRTYIGMFQDFENLHAIDHEYVIKQTVKSPPSTSTPVGWPSTKALAVYGDLLLALNANIAELVVLNKYALEVVRSIPLGAPSDATAITVVDGRVLVASHQSKELIVVDAPLP